MLVAMAMVMMYLLCIDDYYRVKVLRWIGFDLLVGGKFSWKLKIWNHSSPSPAFSCLRNDRPNHLWRDGGREELHAGLGAQLSLLELRARLRRSRHDVRHCRPLSRGSADNAAERTGTGPARKAGVSYGALSLGGKSIDAHSYIPDLKSQQSI